MSTLKCWNCGGNLDDVPRPISRHEQCSACFEALHCCRLCRHYRPKASVACVEDRADPPVVKENANFCDWFSPDSAAFSGQRIDKSTEAQTQLSELFGAEAEGQNHKTEPAPATPEDSTKSQLDDLFSKD